MESWQYGPVIRSVYHALKSYGDAPVTEPILVDEESFTPLESRVINVIYKQYGELDGLKLSQMTHAEGSPWQQTYLKDKRVPLSQPRNQGLLAELIDKREGQEHGA